MEKRKGDFGMEWTRQKLAHYLGNVRTTVEFAGITGDELVKAFHEEAVMRLKHIEEIVYNEYQSDLEKIKSITEIIENPSI